MSRTPESPNHCDDVREIRALNGTEGLNVADLFARVILLTNRHRIPGTPRLSREDIFGTEPGDVDSGPMNFDHD